MSFPQKFLAVPHITRFLSNIHGNLAMTTSIMLLPIIASLGLAIDYSYTVNVRTQLQARLDAAVLAGITHDGTEHERRDEAHLFLEYDVPSSTTITELDFVINGNTMSGTLTANVQTIFMKIFNKDTVTIEVKSAATTLKSGGTPMCVLALEPTGDKAIEASGGSSLNATDCSVQVNSSHSKAVNLSGGAAIQSARNCIVGGVSSGLQRITPPPEPDCQPVPDPFAALPRPAVGSCDHNKLSLNKSSTIYPGVYCGGLKLSDNTFYLEPGLYIIKDGQFESSGSATIIGDGVTIYFVGSNVGISWSGGGSYRFSATRTGPLAGFVVYLDPLSTPNSKSDISGGGDTRYEGVLYFPNQTLNISGGGSIETPSPFTAFVANDFRFSGGSTFTIQIDPSKTDVPIPRGLFGKGTEPRLLY